jgi:hypothetical protein
MIKKTIVVLTAIALSACSSIRSIESPLKGTASVDGLTYYMPKKDILVTIRITRDKTDKCVSKEMAEVTFGTTSSYPDLSKQYVLRHGENVFGQNVLNVTVNEAGLLASTTSTTKSGVTDAFKNLAKTAAALSPKSQKSEGKLPERCADGVHSFVYEVPYVPGSRQPACGFYITITPRGNLDNVVPHSKTVKEEYSGIFYRQNIPYLVSAEGNNISVASIVFSPTESETHFLPVSQTFFSNNEADFGFTEGIPTKYNQSTDGELVALFKLPADILGAYFTAIGTVFDSFKSKDTNEAAALAESLKLELAKKKYDACISAINARDTKLIDELGCNK